MPGHCAAQRFWTGASQTPLKLSSTLAGTSAAMYWGTGIFGAALLGQEAVTTANILENSLGDGWWQGVLNLAFAGKISHNATAVADL